MNEDVKNLLPDITDGITIIARPKPAAKQTRIAETISNKAQNVVSSIGRTVDSLISVFAPQTALNRIHARLAIRSFDASNIDRTTADVDYRRTDSDSELRSRRQRLMSISREEQRNDAFFSNGVRTLRNNVIGDDQSEEGISIRANVIKANGETDEEMNALIDEMWAKDKDKIDLIGRWKFNEIMSLAQNSFVISGEVLGIIHDVAALGSDLPFSIEMLEPDHLPTSNEAWSSGAYAPFAPIKNEKGSTTGYILDGIEYDTYRRIVAYHVLQFHPGNEFMFQPLQTKRVPIQRVIHYFEPNRPEAARGAPFASSGLSPIFNTNELIKSEMQAARAQTCFPIHFKTIPSALPFTSNGSGAPVYDSAGNPVEQIQTSMYTYGDSEPTMMRSERVNAQFVPFVQFEGMRAGCAMNMSRSSYMKDATGLNLSSMREDKIEDRRGYSWFQGMHSRYFIQKFWPRYIRALVLKGRINVKSMDDFERLCGHEIGMPEWGYVNPEQEIKADEIAVAMGKKLPRDLIGKRPYKDHCKKFAEDIEEARKAGLNFAWFEGETAGSKKSSGEDDDTLKGSDKKSEGSALQGPDGKFQGSAPKKGKKSA